jgi:hypothetical protein
MIATSTAIADLVELLERVPLLLKLDQPRPVDEAMLCALDALAPSVSDIEYLDVVQTMALATYFHAKGDPVAALDCLWAANERADEVERGMIMNSLHVLYVGYCPGIVPPVVNGLTKALAL